LHRQKALFALMLVRKYATFYTYTQEYGHDRVHGFGAHFQRRAMSLPKNIRPIHPFPARVAPELVWDELPDHTTKLRVLDPMAGSGTTLVTARLRGHEAIGFDRDPLAVLIARAWLTNVEVGKAEERRRNSSPEHVQRPGTYHFARHIPVRRMRRQKPLSAIGSITRTGFNSLRSRTPFPDFTIQHYAI
jgi:hypothetical protein